MTQTEMPELMTQREYVAAQTELDRVAGIESAGSLFRVGAIEAAHLQHVRTAVAHLRDIHIDNWTDYRAFIPGLAGYAFNGNLAVHDSNKGQVWDRARQYREAVSISDGIERKRAAKRAGLIGSSRLRR